MTDAITFRGWPKTPRLRREALITEKIDGTNAAVIVTDDGQVGAQSRNRLIAPGDDNYGFARWVADNSAELAEILGPGHHYGEWWGSKIQRGYGLTDGERRFSLFNVNRYSAMADDFANVPGLGIVPALAYGAMSDALVEGALDRLDVYGSQAAPGYMRPEGIIVYHTAAQQVFKVLLENDDQPKGNAA